MLNSLKMLLAIVFMLHTLSSQADTSVWKISSDEHHLYLVGTMHVLDQKDYPLPSEFDQAYQESTHLIFETNMGDMATPNFQQRVMQALVYQDGTSLRDRLSESTLKLLVNYLDKNRIPAESMMGFKPGLLLSVLTMFELQSIGIDSKGVDDHFFQRAESDGKRDSAFESIDDQLGFLAQMGVDNPDRFVRYLLEEINQISTQIVELREAWRNGDMDAMDTLFIEPMEIEYPVLYKQILRDRNYRWMPQINLFLSDATVEMVLVGAAHLAGDHGLLTLLEEAGYRVERL